MTCMHFSSASLSFLRVSEVDLEVFGSGVSCVDGDGVRDVGGEEFVVPGGLVDGLVVAVEEEDAVVDADQMVGDAADGHGHVEEAGLITEDVGGIGGGSARRASLSKKTWVGSAVW